MKYGFYNKEILPIEEIRLPVNDLAVLRGYGVFDYMRTYNGRPFQIERHLKRFFSSAFSLHLKIALSEEEIEKIITELLNKNNQKEAAIRLILTGGATPDGITMEHPTFATLIEDLPQYPNSYYKEGIKLMTQEYQRELPETKTINYLNAVRSASECKAKGAFDILYHSDGEVRETTRTNFFIIKNGTLITPSEKILKGVTRSVVLELAKEVMPVEERTMATTELVEADEAYITGTTKRIMPVTQIDNNKVGNGKVGEHTIKLMNLFDAFTEKN